MKCLIISVILAISSCLAYSYLQVRLDGDKRIFLQRNNQIVVFSVPKSDPTSVKIVAKGQNRPIKVIEVDNQQKVVKEFSVDGRGEHGSIEKYVDENEGGQQKLNTSQPSTNKQMHVLNQIFRRYSGQLQEEQFFNLTKEVKQAVSWGELSPVFYDVLKIIEIQPTNSGNTDINTQRPFGEDHAEISKNKSLDNDVQHEQTTIRYDTNEQGVNKSQALQAIQQIKWIQGLVEMRRKQQLEKAKRYLAQQDDSIAETEEFLNASKQRDDKNEYVDQMVSQTDIHELQREIAEKQAAAQSLQSQQQFLSNQRQQLQLLLEVTAPKLGSARIEEMKQVNEEIGKHELKLIEAEIRVQKQIRRLQEHLEKQLDELKNKVKK